MEPEIMTASFAREKLDALQSTRHTNLLMSVNNKIKAAIDRCDCNVVSITCDEFKYCESELIMLGYIIIEDDGYHWLSF